MIDFYGRLWKGAQRTTEKSRLNLARGLTVMYGILVMLIAFQAHKMGTLVEATNKAIGLVGGPLLGMFILGMFSKGANARGAITGWVAGLLVVAVVCFDSHVSFLWYTLSGFLVTISVGRIASTLFPPPESRNIESLTWETRYLEMKDETRGSPDLLNSSAGSVPETSPPK
jgi:Na+/proline symporter